MFTVCVLAYGDSRHLLARCLESLLVSSPRGFVSEFRIGLNYVSRESHEFAQQWAESVAKTGLTTRFYRPVWPTGSPAYKYPLMRRMFRQPVLNSSYVMWFDDDSYVTHADWWPLVTVAVKDADCVGQLQRRAMNNAQWLWMSQQRWFNRSLSKPANFIFPQGAWWVLSSRCVSSLDWPIPELRHCGGDAMLGEACRHRGIEVKPWCQGVRINADNLGRQSQAIRRGYSEEILAWNYSGDPLPVDHQEFRLDTWTV